MEPPLLDTTVATSVLPELAIAPVELAVVAPPAPVQAAAEPPSKFPAQSETLPPAIAGDESSLLSLAAHSQALLAF